MFQRFPVTFPHLSCRIPRDPVAGIIDLGIFLHIFIEEKHENFHISSAIDFSHRKTLLTIKICALLKVIIELIILNEFDNLFFL